MLIIGSVFASSDPTQCRWLDLQLSQLRATTTDFHHVTVLYGKPSDHFSEQSEVHMAGRKRVQSEAHVFGLNMLADIFRSSRADKFLFLDSDAFPTRSGWQELLDQ